MNLDNLPDPSSDLAFVHPGHVFRGLPLNNPATGYRLLWQQVIISQDGERQSAAYIAWALVYLLSLDKKKAREIAFERAKFRQELLEWMDQFEGAATSTDEATAIFDKVWNSWEGSKVEVQSDGGADPKNA
jgi:hypothetical protein